MIEVSSKVASRRIEALAEELGYVSSTTFLQGLGITQKASKEALSFLKAHFPKGSQGSKSPSSKNEFGMPLENSFYAEPFAKGTKVGFFIGTTLKGTRAEVVIQALDDGSRNYSVDYSNPIKFLGSSAFAKKSRKTKNKMVWFSLTGVVNYPAREGHHFIDKTRQFIEDVILVDAKANFAAKVANRLRRINRVN